MNEGRQYPDLRAVKLGTNLSKFAKAKGLTIAQLARESKVPLSTLHGWTTGRAAVQLEQLAKVAAVLQIPIYELAFGHPDPFESPGEEILREIFSGDVRVTLHRIERTKKRKS